MLYTKIACIPIFSSSQKGPSHHFIHSHLLFPFHMTAHEPGGGNKINLNPAVSMRIIWDVCTFKQAHYFFLVKRSQFSCRLFMWTISRRTKRLFFTQRFHVALQSISFCSTISLSSLSYEELFRLVKQKKKSRSQNTRFITLTCHPFLPTSQDP